MTDDALLRNPELISRRRSTLLVVDIQEKLVPAIHLGEVVAQRTLFLLNAAEQLRIPVVVSEQYPQGLGPTVSELRGHAAVGHIFDKTCFSAAECFCAHLGISPEMAADADGSRDQVILAGIESHVCVLQTALDLLGRGFRVYVVEDATGSGTQRDHEIAMQRMRDAGVVICSAESAVFEWCETADAEEFKALSRLVRGLRAEST